MNKWQLARYLIDAKKCVDSVLFISWKLSDLANISVRGIINEKRQSFYMNCCIILDTAYSQKGAKKALCSTDSIAHDIYYQRDKNYAHKDSDYEPIEYADLAAMAEDMKKQISHTLNICGAYLPLNVTLDFVPHDPILFRMVSGITKDIEDKINHLRYYKSTPSPGEEYAELPAFTDTEDIRGISEADRAKYAVMFKMGINSNESLQNHQDSCIRVNVLHGLNMWVGRREGAEARIQATINEIAKAAGIPPWDAGSGVIEIEFGAVPNWGTAREYGDDFTP